MSRKLSFFWISFCTISGLILGYYLHSYLEKNPQNYFSEVRHGGGKLINPLYECAPDQTFGSREYKNLENDISNYINTSISAGEVKNVSIYFRDLNNGPWFGVNEKENFAPASLLKLPILIAYLKESEINPEILNKRIKIKNKIDDHPQIIEPEVKLKSDKEYDVNFLLNKMIVDSDNQAFEALNSNISNNKVLSVYNDLQLPTNFSKDDFMSVKEYSSLFRILFNASYLNKENSENALKILSNSKYDDGLRKPIPPQITVAHKFGEREVNNLGLVIQLHDCGIVYYPNHPYLVCIMTRGTSIDKQTKITQDLSKMIFVEVNKRYKAL